MFVSIIIAFILFDLLPATILTIGLRTLFKRKFSKGICLLCIVASLFITFTLLFFITGKAMKCGLIDIVCPAVIVFTFLYDKTIPSIFDTEKQLKEKMQNK